MFLISFFNLILCDTYPLIIGVPSEVIVSTPSSLFNQGNLPENFCVIIIEKRAFQQISTFRQLLQWGDSLDICSNFGKVKEFPTVESNIVNFLDKIKGSYNEMMTIDTRKHCPCKIRDFKGGLVVVRIPDNEPETLDEIIPYLPQGTGIAFIASTPTLFKD